MEAPSKADQTAARPVRAEEASSGAIYSFVPAHGASRAGALARYLSRILSERFGAEGSGRSVLLADFDPQGYSVWRATEARRRLDGRTWGAFVSEANGHDVLDACEVHARRLHASDVVFLVSSSDRPSLEMVRDKADWLRSIDLGERCGLLLSHTRRGVSPAEAEEITGLPVSTVEDIGQLAAA